MIITISQLHKKMNVKGNSEAYSKQRSLLCSEESSIVTSKNSQFLNSPNEQ